jgi:hypothetical protein
MILLAAVCACSNEPDNDEDSDARKCDALLDAVYGCFDEYCAGAGTSEPFCQCWAAGQSIDVATCACVPENFAATCDDVNLDEVDPTEYDCPRATSLVSEPCN